MGHFDPAAGNELAGVVMKRSSKENLRTGLKVLVLFGVLGGLIALAAVFAPENPTEGATFLNDVADRHRY